MCMKTYKVVGISTKNNVTKFRVTNSSVLDRTRILVDDGHVNITLIELDTPLSKLEAIDYFKKLYPAYSSVKIPNASAHSAMKLSKTTGSIESTALKLLDLIGKG